MFKWFKTILEFLVALCMYFGTRWLASSIVDDWISDAYSDAYTKLDGVISAIKELWVMFIVATILLYRKVISLDGKIKDLEKQDNNQE